MTSPALSSMRRRQLMSGLLLGATAAACRALTPEEQAAAAAAAEAGPESIALGYVPGEPLPSIHPELTPVADLAEADSSEVHATYAPAVPPAADRTEQRRFTVELEVLEGVCPLDPANDVSTLMWGYRVNGDDVSCGSPGPVLRGRVGDIAHIVLTNPASNELAHNIDFHAVAGQGGGAEALTVLPGETASIEARLLYPGAFMYHCAFGDVPHHIIRGMYGMFIVDPETPLPPADHEWAVMQSEWYVGDPDDDGLVDVDREALLAEEPAYVTFNGRTDALVGDNALQMAVGERARIYMVNEGLNLDSNFHPIGSHWDAVWPEAATHESNAPLRGSQSTLVVAGGGTVVDLVGVVPSTIILVDHALVRTFYKGAIGQVVISGAEDAEVFSATAAAAAGVAGAEPAPEEATEEESAASGAVATDAVDMPPGAYDPNQIAYSPDVIVVPVGTTVTWTNSDQLPHTVTSGTSDGRAGEPDGIMDSGDMAPGDTFSFTFNEAGEYPYYCTPHPWMRGAVLVEEA